MTTSDMIDDSFSLLVEFPLAASDKASESSVMAADGGDDSPADEPPASERRISDPQLPTSCEICVVDEPAEILKAIAEYKAKWKKLGVVIDENDVNSFVGGWTARAEAFPLKPVSLARCSEVLDQVVADGSSYSVLCRRRAKAVLDAAGVKYVD